MSESRELQLSLERDNLKAETDFEQIIDSAVDIFLSSPDIFAAELQKIQARDAALFDGRAKRNLGAWPVRVMTDLQSSGVSNLIDGFVRTELIKQTPFFTYPGTELSSSLKPNLLVQQKIEAFGQAIIEEAFNCLGDEAIEKVKEFQDADNPNKLLLLDWLIKRIRDIGKKAKEPKIIPPEDITPEMIQSLYDAVNTYIDAQESKDQDSQAAPENPVTETEEDEEDDSDNSEYFYHPARLSPKLIGNYPNINIEPTCLGYSLLISAFFNKAGIPYFHAGIGINSLEGVRMAINDSIKTLQKTYKNWGLELPIEKSEFLENVHGMNQASLERHIGFHAATLAKIEDDGWLQIDTNYTNFAFFIGPDSKDLDSRLYYLQQIHNHNAERGIELKYNNYFASKNINFNVKLQEMAENPVIVDEIDEFLRDIPSETAFSHILEEMFSDYKPENYPTQLKSLRFFIEEIAKHTTLEPSEFLHSDILRVLIKFVFQDAKNDDLTDSINRCKTDASYRRRRAEDLAQLPLFYIFCLQSYFTSEVVDGKISSPHLTLELGLPAYRIGACVLSDYAVYCEDTLPLSFWLTYWSSQVSLAEHYENTPNESQKALLLEAANNIDDTGLNYYALRGIIRDVHEQKRKCDDGEHSR